MQEVTPREVASPTRAKRSIDVVQAGETARNDRSVVLRIRPCGALLLLLIPLLALPLTSFAEGRFAGQVVAVADGDTLTMLDPDRVQHRIRLEGIDAPEKTQPFGQTSRQSLSELAFGRTATATCSKKDRYGRAVCKVEVSGRDVGLEQLRRGLAWHFKRYEKDQAARDRVTYADAEATARRFRVGLWQDEGVTAPWTWRTSQ